MKQIAENLARVKEQINAAAGRSGRTAGAIKLVAITKGRSIEEIQTLLDVGQNLLGENRVQEAKQKYDQIQSISQTPLDKHLSEWHLVGHLQRNKVKSALEMFTLIHSVDSIRLLVEIAKRAEIRKQTANILIQINTTDEEGKFGLESNSVVDFIESSLSYPHARIVGLMTMGKFTASADENRRAFALLRSISETITNKKFPGITMQYLSMGMTNDFDIAIEEGANIVRIGRAIFDGAN